MKFFSVQIILIYLWHISSEKVAMRLLMAIPPCSKQIKSLVVRMFFLTAHFQRGNLKMKSSYTMKGGTELIACIVPKKSNLKLMVCLWVA